MLARRNGWTWLIICLMSLTTIPAAGHSPLDAETAAPGPDAATRLALVIGNAAYGDPPLAGPVRDAEALKKLLEQLGFEVYYRENADRQAMAALLDDFLARIHGRRIVLFYFSGCGVQVHGRNYLLPVGASLTSAADVESTGFCVSELLAKMKAAATKLNVVILDACREPPFKGTFVPEAKGLKDITVPSGTIVSFSAAPYCVLADHPEGNSLYMKRLLYNLRKPALSIRQVLVKTSLEVMEDSAGEQIPWISLAAAPEIRLAAGPAPRNEKRTGATAPDAAGIPESGRLVVETIPRGARILVAETERGRSPAAVSELEPGPVKVRAELDGHQPYEQMVTILSGETVTLRWKLQPSNAEGRLYVNVQPDDAAVEIKNIPKSYEPGMELTAGDYDMLVSKDGFKPWRKTVHLSAGERLILDVRLERKPEVRAGSRPGEIWVEPVTGMKFVWIPGDCFQMGSRPSEEGHYRNEEPVHPVCVDGFWMGRTEVTNAQYRRYRSYHDSGNFQDHDLNGDDQPVVWVSWDDAHSFAEWLTEQSGGRYRFRLPTEAQWEYACRAGSSGSRFWGEDADQTCTYANVNDASARTLGSLWGKYDCRDGYPVTSPVARFQPNRFGLYDMLGNVTEWCEDWYDKRYYDYSPENNPLCEDDSSGRRVLRGGSWVDRPRIVRCANRTGGRPEITGNAFGFRLVRLP